VLRDEVSPTIVIPAGSGWDDYLLDRSANFRQQVRRRTRKLSGALGIRFRFADDPGRLSADMDALIRLHGAQWGGRSRAFRGAREAFHREFAKLALERGWLRLWLAEAEGAPVAAWYGFRFGAAEYFYQSGRDPAWDKYRLGAGLLEHSMREAFADGMREYRLLRGDEAYKQRYATETRRLLTIAVPRTLGGWAAVVGASVAAASGSGRRLLQRISPGA
jgi:CelD/BcsL family acetyltransferase involved in cellulose biosynthesis